MLTEVLVNYDLGEGIVGPIKGYKECSTCNL